MRKLFSLLAVSICFHIAVFSQKISGQFTRHVNKNIRFEIYEGLSTKIIEETKTDSTGSFSFNYSRIPKGMACLYIENSDPLLIILSGENITLKGLTINQKESIVVESGIENQLFFSYASEATQNDRAISAIDFLVELYANDRILSPEKTFIKSIENEKSRIINKEYLFYQNLPDTSYFKWYLLNRKMIQSAPDAIMKDPKTYSSLIHQFRNLIYTDDKFYRSGLLKYSLDTHIWLLENSVYPLDTAYREIKISIDSILNHSSRSNELLNEIVNHLFSAFEKKSLFKASAHLSKIALERFRNKLDKNIQFMLEGYIATKIGNKFKNIDLQSFIAKNKSCSNFTNLSAIDSPNTLIIFGASWCRRCIEETAKLLFLYEKWRAKGLEVVFISLDTYKEAFAAYTSQFPFPSVCSFEGWKTQIAVDFYVTTSPSFFILDSEMKIVLRPTSINQIDSWVDWKYQQ